jgi:transposase-like protein
MAKNRHTAEQIISKLREAEVDLAKGMKMLVVCRKLGITEQTYYRWRKEYRPYNAANSMIRRVRVTGQAKTVLPHFW